MTYYLLFIAISVAIDWYFIEKRNREPNKTMMWSIRAAVTVVFVFGKAHISMWAYVAYGFFLATLFYSLFDYSLNIARGKPFFHKGQNWIDRLVPAGFIDFGFKIILLSSAFAIYQYDFIDCLRIGILENGFWHDVMKCW